MNYQGMSTQICHPERLKGEGFYRSPDFEFIN